MKKNNNFFDSPLLLFILLIMVLSIISLFSAQKYVTTGEVYYTKQIIWFCLSIFVMFSIFYFDFYSIKRLAPYIYGFGVFLLIFVLIAPNTIAPTIKGAKSWIVLPALGSIQPSEFMKICLIIMLAFVVTNHAKKYLLGDIKSDLKLLLKIGIIAAIPIALTLLQNDFGTSLVMTVIVIGIIFVSGINWVFIITFLILGITTILGLAITYLKNPDSLLKFLDAYQLNRIHSWLDPFGNAQGIGYQLKQSILSIGSGTLKGKGIGESNVYVPEAHTDFIFAILAEETGFIGASLLLCIYFLIIYRIIVIALYSARFEFYICCGMVALLTFHIFQNIGMVIGLIPITGIPLPLMSYGGSSVMSTMIGLSLILNISLKKKYYMFSKN